MPFCNPTVLPPSSTGKSVLTDDLGNLICNNKVHKHWVEDSVHVMGKVNISRQPLLPT